MSGAVVDPDILSQFGGASAPAAAPSSDAPAGTGAVVDPDMMKAFDAAPAAASNQTPIAPQPQAPAAPVAPAQALSASSSFGPLQTADDVVGMVSAGVPFSDRISAGLATLAGTGPGKDYASNLAAQRSYDATLAARYPMLSRVLGFGGGAASLAAAAPEDALASGATLGSKVLAGLRTGAAAGGVQGASSAGDLTNLPQAARSIAEGAATGTILGGAVPLAGRALGSAYEGVANSVNGGVDGMSRGAASPLLGALSADTPAAVQSRIATLGPQGMLADAGPAFLGKTQGVALNSDPARAIVGNALAGRDAGTNARIGQDLNAALGPGQSPLLASQGLQAQRGVAHAGLPGVFAAAPPVDTSSVLTTIGQGLNKAVGPEAAVLGRAKSYLMQQGIDAQGNPVTSPVTDAETLQNAKMALDTLIDHGDPSLGVTPGAVSKSQGAVGAVRGQLNQALRDQVPGYAGIMDQSSGLARQMNGIEGGNSVLQGGAGSPDSSAFSSQVANMSPEERAGMMIGARGAIDRAVGTKANDLQAVKNALQGENGWNSAKLSTLFGQQPVQDVADSVDRNAAFRDTYNKVVQNSQTAQRQAAQSSMAPSQPSGIPIINPNMRLMGALLTGVKKVGGAAVDALRPDPTGAYGEVANVLTAQGPQRDAYLKSLSDALIRRGQNASTGEYLGDRAALASALLGGAGLRGRLSSQ